MRSAVALLFTLQLLVTSAIARPGQQSEREDFSVGTVSASKRTLGFCWLTGCDDGQFCTLTGTCSTCDGGFVLLSTSNTCSKCPSGELIIVYKTLESR